MTKVFRAKKKKVLDGYEKPLWVDVGFTMLQGEYDGKATYSLIDERTGEKFSLFRVEKKQDPAPEPAYDSIPTSGPLPVGEEKEDVPF